MLGAVYRFHGLNSLNKAYKNGKTFRGGAYSLKYLENKSRTTPRFAVVVSRKVSKSAVKRNRIRRRIYEILRGQIPKTKNGADIIFTVHNEKILDQKQTDLSSSITDLLKKTGLI